MASLDRLFAQQARTYFECADAADDIILKWPRFENGIATLSPIMLLIAFSIELSQKSFLLKSGVEISKLKEISHDLGAGYRECQKFDIPEQSSLNEVNLNILAIISDLHRSMSLRYLTKSRLSKIPVYGPLSEVARKSLIMCDAPSKSGLQGYEEFE